MSENSNGDRAANAAQPLTPHLVCAGAAEAIEFYKRAFGAEEQMRLTDGGGKLIHAAVTINGAMVMLMDEFTEHGILSPKSIGGTAVALHLIVPDADAWMERAVAAGATVKMPVGDQFWGDRYGVIEDPFGHDWAIATPQPGAPATEAELAEAMAKALPM